jgi:very-short-patch-repair endonuclease
MSFVRADVALRALGRMARTAELTRRGVTRVELTRAVREGRAIRPRQGVYALPEENPAIVHAAQHGGAIGCCGAAALHGLWILAVPAQHHIWMGTAGTRRSHCTDCRLHWDAGRVEVGTLPSVANVLLQIALCEGEESFFAALESAFRLSRLPAGETAWLWRHLPLELRWLVGFARADADSGLESLIRLRLHRIGITVRTQVSIQDVGEVDFVIGERLIVEADGRANHEREKERAKDLRRDAIAAGRGFTTLRFTYALIVHEWPLVEAAIVGAVSRGAHLVA